MPEKSGESSPSERAAAPGNLTQANARAIVPKSEGQRLLLALPLSVSQIVAGVGGVSKASVSQWRHGMKTPGPAFRAKLLEHFEIPAEAWAEVPATPDSPPKSGAKGGPSPSRARARPPSMPAAEVPTAREDCLAALARLRAALDDKKLIAAERNRLEVSFLRYIAMRRRIELDVEMTEDRIVREHPTWARVKRALVRALVPYPKAAAAVDAALSDLEV